MKQDDGFESKSFELVKIIVRKLNRDGEFWNIARSEIKKELSNALRQVSEEAFRKGQLDAEKAIRCEGRDPNGTIWEHADMVQKENALLKDLINTSTLKEYDNLQKENEALNISIGVLNKRVMTAMELLRQWRFYAPEKNYLMGIAEETDEFLKGEK